MHVRFKFWYISLPSSAKQQREMPKFKVLWRAWAHDSKFSFSVLTWRPFRQFCYWIVRPHCRSWTNWNKPKVVQVTGTCIFKWRFRWRCRRGYVKSPLGTLRNHDGNANENAIWKYKFVVLVLLCPYSNSFNFYNVAELSSNRNGENGLQVRTENENLLPCAHLLNFGISRCCLTEDCDEMYQNL